MADGGNSRSGVSVRLAYLCNLYPAVSHSFVRREIAGVEQAGHEVHRFSLRPPKDDLKDEADLAEAARTEAVLARGPLRLVFAAVLLLLARPIRTLRAVRAAYRLSGRGFDQKFRHFAYWLEAAWLVRRLERLGVEHLHAHFGTNPAAVALIVRAWGGPPFSFTAHGPDEFDAPVALSLSQKVAAARFVAAISSFGRSQLMRWSEPCQWSKIKVIRCGLDKSFLEEPRNPAPAGSIEFVCVARLAPQKGLPLLIAACERLRTAGAAFTLTIIGDGELREELDVQIRKLKVDDRISVAGTCTSAEIRQHLLRARAFVLPSFAEGLPVVIMEALALARPVVTTAIAGIPELVDSECGWVIPAGSEDALVEALSRALRASADELAAKGECGRTRVHQMHHAGKNALLMSALMTGNSA
jgi:glycosyltransferase involved in cell wall biosynthesis